MMEKATSNLRRGGAFLLSFGTGHQELNLIISDLKILKSQVKAIIDSQQVILHDITNWTCVDENRALQELFLNLSNLNSLWSEVQAHFADQISEFKHQFEMILEGERSVDAARNKFTNCEAQEQKAQKKLKKVQKKQASAELSAAKAKVEECQREKDLTQAEVSEKIKENEAVKLIRVKDGLLKLTEAYLALSHKCIYIFEAQRDIVKSLPDIEDKEIHEIKFEGLSGAKEALERARTLVKDYRMTHPSSSTSSSQQGNIDPPPPYSPSPYFSNPPYNPHYSSPEENPTSSRPRSLYPTVGVDEDLARSVDAAKI